MLNGNQAGQAAAFLLLCAAAAFGQTGSAGEVSWPGYLAAHNGLWFHADSLVGPWVLAEYVPPELYTIPAVCPFVSGGFVCVYTSGDFVGDFYSGWGWDWGFRRQFHRLPDVIVAGGGFGANGARAGPRAQQRSEARRGQRSEARSEPRSEARSEPRSEARSAAD
ncbi:MAG TPA: hypothetical protein VKV17_03010 [Bryobacteraceae bacterium]|nr:hypothetical protein [Bryobacteraceae bacterium]